MLLRFNFCNFETKNKIKQSLQTQFILMQYLQNFDLKTNSLLKRFPCFKSNTGLGHKLFMQRSLINDKLGVFL
jgi:hypothetical protein